MDPTALTYECASDQEHTSWKIGALPSKACLLHQLNSLLLLFGFYTYSSSEVWNLLCSLKRSPFLGTFGNGSF